ncbi:nicotinamide-nucleotide adenylyltransferase [Sphingosinicella ginsenosidimutans]|uniref:AAA family ATPase n=1 Tax=Allosphingosinicella ginsenosidimutans TaxID=1176539 RepID=A0A5C6TQD9_9SPHN|nr:AAA family ATPase [Sphingosinicella ginsenosidimutans]TXC62400.1 AAA family ATPase [Sphingosinicella ginsenosidimutans]
MTTRGFVLGKFMPPHAGHQLLCGTAGRMVDELTILVCSLPGDPIPGELRLAWMRALFPHARVIGHDAIVPQAAEDSADFWPIWRAIVKAAHPEPIDYVFAGEAYGLRLAEEVGGTFVPVGARIMGQDPRGLGGLSGSAVRADPWAHWPHLPPPVRGYYAKSICLHGVESTGKSVMSDRLARHFGTIWVPEYGRAHCETHGLELTEADLLLIGRAQAAMVEAARPLCDRRLIVDTDALMTAAWCEMLFDRIPEPLLAYPKADLYLLLEPDVEWVDDGTRFFGTPDRRARFAAICRRLLEEAGVTWVSIGGRWEDRFEQAVAAIEGMDGAHV